MCLSLSVIHTVCVYVGLVCKCSVRLCMCLLCLVSLFQVDTVSFGGFSLGEESKTLIPGSLFQQRDKAESTSASSVAMTAAQACMAY